VAWILLSAADIFAIHNSYRLANSDVQNNYYLILLFAGISFVISSCGITGRMKTPDPTRLAVEARSKQGAMIEEGVASWYGPNFHGKLTANGEVYDMYGLTAAHRTLPFNTIVRVENAENNKSVVVRINDRGPFAKDRIIDLSKKAAEEIDMLGPGTAPVRLYLIDGDLENSRTTNLKVATYTVQLGSFETKERAIEKSLQIEGSRIEEVRLNNQIVYRVYFGVYTDPNEAAQKQQELAINGFNGYVKQIQN
jgi:rare lipoprotein A